MLTVENNTGLPNADSMVTLAFANEYHLSRGNEAWGQLSDTRREQLLRLAYDYILFIIAPSFVGTKAFPMQRAPFPRLLNYNLIPVPIDIMEAQAELALIADKTPLMPNAQTIRKKMVKVGPITVEYDASSWNGPKFVAALARFNSFMDTRSVGMTARLVRT